MGLLDHMVTLFIFRFLRNLHTLFHSDWDTNSMQEGSLFSTSSPACIICRIFDIAILTSVRWYLTEVLICISLIMKWYWASFHVTVHSLYVFFGEMSIYVFCPLFDWGVFLILSCISCLYSLEINPCWLHHSQVFSRIPWAVFSLC